MTGGLRGPLSASSSTTASSAAATPPSSSTKQPPRGPRKTPPPTAASPKRFVSSKTPSHRWRGCAPASCPAPTSSPSPPGTLPPPWRARPGAWSSGGGIPARHSLLSPVPTSRIPRTT
ncbi:unnamed protein product [Linum tenue]|uniref:Uncharacterized protein n=1 Tax=Linum tenue TaxID=586396 RepID=A0AAV0QYE0_9ROSI|nr:unnamed protein product [Linum tenue]